ncbi:ABC transporter permease [Bifidobacterium biavatii]|uniref:ABC transporter n=1 Tax=Bifidobacterium biavatii DSM 23969 TaxID=1437608 RepID=A0A086Z661_9BIFI|nr:ABC transporter permease [Bifidobacterium biavatii]KFI42011.1 ABC transporter [Bifidobacterium biavatii DSM 23969]
MADMIRMTWFHMRTLWATSFFLETAIGAPLSFILLKLIAAQWRIGQSLWLDASVSGLWATTTLAVGIIGFQRFQGVLQYLAASVMQPWRVFLPLVSAASLIGIIGVPVSFAVIGITAVLTGGPMPMVTSVQFVGYLLAVVACCSSAMLLASVFVLSRMATAFEPLILIPVWLLCGIVIPVDMMPVPVRLVSFLHPLTSAVWIARQPSMGWTCWVGIAGCLALSAVYAAASLVGLRVALRRARVEGTLDLA